MGDYGMTSPKPGSIKGNTPETANPMESGSLGDDMADDDDRYAVPGNPDKGMLGGDNSPNPPRFMADGQPAPPGVMSHDYAWPGDTPLFEAEGNPSADELKRWFRGGSDALGMDGRSGGA